MTSSLVGSEMCIRDRVRRPRSGTHTRNTAASSTCLNGKTKRQQRGSCPVSYTHLTLPTICSV
eukprot:10068664-Prorocentrum_lima.AAC.1